MTSTPIDSGAKLAAACATPAGGLRADAPLAVLGVDPELRFAGGESQVLALTVELRRAGHRAELLCDPRGELFGRARAADLPCHPLKIRNALDFGAGLRMRAVLRRGHYDIVHFHTARAHAIAPFAKGLARALVVTRRMDYPPNRLFAPYMYNRAVDGVAAISRGVADSLAKADVALSRVTVIPSGVDCERFRPPGADERAAARAALKLGPDEIAVGAVGMLEARKGHRYLLEAIAEPAAARDPAALRCFIVGDGSLRGELQRAIVRLGLEGRVRLTGGVEDPRAVLWALDIFAFPSLNEGLGVALLEAMGCGLAAVAANVGGVGEVIEDGRSGRLVEPGSAHPLARAIAVLAADRAMRERFGAAARHRIVERFSIAAMARATLELYRTCLGRAGLRAGSSDGGAAK